LQTYKKGGLPSEIVECVLQHALARALATAYSLNLTVPCSSVIVGVSGDVAHDGGLRSLSC
jgi:hypothetical protein